MIHSFTIANYLGDKIEIDLRKPEISGFLIQSVTGLGPVKATVNTVEVATDDGSMYNSARLSQRNIVFQLIYRETISGESIEDVRQKSYTFFSVKRKIEVIIETDNRKVKTTGYIESNEPNIFSSQEGSQISIICPDPYFYSIDDETRNYTNLYGTNPLFEFPFSNESLNESLLEFGAIQTHAEGVVTYHGDTEVGVTISIHIIGSVSNIQLFNTTTKKKMVINTDKIKKVTGDDISIGDDIVMSTIRGKKGVTFIKNGMAYNVLNCLDKNTDWITIIPGDNILAFSAETGEDNLQVRIEYFTVYEGV